MRPCGYKIVSEALNCTESYFDDRDIIDWLKSFHLQWAMLLKVRSTSHLYKSHKSKACKY